MDFQAHRLLIIGLLSAAVVGCSTTPPPVSPRVAVVQTPTAKPAPPPVKRTSSASPHVPPAPGPRAASSPPAPAGDLIQKGRILVTKEEYQKTFDDIRQLIEQLNQIIAARDYEAWTEHLTSEYVRTYSNPQTLSLISNQPMLVRQNLRIASLKDYFLYVVVPSRANARLDDLEFINKTQVKAITVIGGKRYILYNLRFEDGSWKIAVSS